jgi:hypothetical protein
VKELFPSFLPKLFKDLPIEYSVIFYQFFAEYNAKNDTSSYFHINNLSDSFLAVLEAKSKNIDATEFIVDNGQFKTSISITEKEQKIMLEYVNEQLKKTELYLNARFDLFNKKKKTLEEVTSILGKGR